MKRIYKILLIIFIIILIITIISLITIKLYKNFNSSKTKPLDDKFKIKNLKNFKIKKINYNDIKHINKSNKYICILQPDNSMYHYNNISYAKHKKYDYISFNKNSNLWAVINDVIKNYEYIVYLNKYMKIVDFQKDFSRIIQQAGDNSMIICRDENNHNKVSLDAIIFRNDNFTKYKLRQFYKNNNDLNIDLNIILDQFYDLNIYIDTLKNFKKYIDMGMPRLLTGICIYNEHSFNSSKSSFIINIKDSINDEDSIVIYPWKGIEGFIEINKNLQNLPCISNPPYINNNDRKIPKYIFQTMETTLTDLEQYKNCNYKIKNINSDYQYFYFDGLDCKLFIKNNFNKDIYDAYNKLIPGAYKCDLWRCCVLYIYGGCYIDSRVIPYIKLDDIIQKENELISAIDIHEYSIWQGFLCSMPRNKILLNCIERMCFFIKNDFYGDDCLDITGPIMFGKVINNYYGRYDKEPLKTLNNNNINLLCFTKECKPFLIYKDRVAFRSKYFKSDSNSDYNKKFYDHLTGKPHYGVLWKNKNVYKNIINKDRLKYYMGKYYNNYFIINPNIIKDNTSKKIVTKENIYKIDIHKEYYKDLIKYIKISSLNEFKLIVWTGDVSHIVRHPIITKSSAIGSDNIILNLNRDRHFEPLYTFNDTIKFNDKKNIVFWRGATTGKQDRFICVKKYFTHPNMDIGFNLYGQNVDEKYEKYKKNSVSINEHCKYKYLLDMEGNDVSTGLKWKMSTNSVIMKTSATCRSWFMEDKLLPWVHYVPLKSDYSDLYEKYIWCENNPDKCLNIINNANIYTTMFINNNENELCSKILKRYVKNIKISENYNFQLEIPTYNKNLADDFISRINWEPKTHKILKEYCLKCPFYSYIIDIGCHIGDTTTKLSDHLRVNNRDDVKILAIDPNKDKIDFINKLCNINNINNIKTIHSGVSDKKTHSFEIKNGHSGMWKLKEDINGNIKVDTLDNICNGINIGLVHLDVEGHEYKALLGMINIIKNNHPPIMLEYLHGEDKKNIFNFLENLSYKQIWNGENNILFI